MYKILQKIRKVKFGGRFAISEFEVGLPDGNKTRFYLRESSAFSLIIPFLTKQKVVMVEQYRFGAKKISLEFPMGVINGKSDIQVAREELEQETGYKAKNWKKIRSFHVSPGWSNQIGNIYIASGLIPGPQKPEPYEFIKVREIKLPAIEELINNGKIFDGSTIVAYFYYKHLFR